VQRAVPRLYLPSTSLSDASGASNLSRVPLVEERP
jgi:hypothetical protein